MRVWLALMVLVVGCSSREHVFDAGIAADAMLLPTADSGRNPALVGEEAGLDDDDQDAGAPGCEPIPPYDAGPRALTQVCGAERCNPDVQYCEVFSPGVMGGSAYYHCKQAPKDCRSNVTCACLKGCLGSNGEEECEDVIDDGGARVAVLGP